MPENRIKNQIDLFRAMIALAMSQHVDLMKIYIMQEKIAGATLQDIQKSREDPDSAWNKEKTALNNTIKREVAGLINEIHHIAYLEPLK